MSLEFSTKTNEQICDHGNGLGHCRIVDNVGRCKTFRAIGCVVTAVSQDADDLVVEEVFSLVCAAKGISMVTFPWSVRATDSMV